MQNSRLDQLTDGAWLLASSILIIAMFERTLTCLEMLVYGDRAAAKPKLLMLAHGAIMVAVSIAAATISLSPEWVRNIVSSLGVGVGFALRDLLYNALVGVQMPYNIGDHLVIASDLNELSDPSKRTSLTVTQTFALGFEAKKDNKGDPFRLSWSYLDHKIVQKTGLDSLIRSKGYDDDLPGLHSTVSPLPSLQLLRRHANVSRINVRR